MVIGDRILSQHLSDVETSRLTLSLVGSETSALVETTTCKHLAPEPLSKLMPGFDNTSAHRLPPGLQKLTNLDYDGAVFHWALAKLPCLQKLNLTHPCVILPDEAPTEVNINLTTLNVSVRSEVLRGNSHHYAAFKAFLAHFPSLEVLRLTMYDLEVDMMPASPSDLEEDYERSFDTLLERLSPVAADLTILPLGVYHDAEDYDGPANNFLRDVQPTSGFQQFKALKNLVAPYQCLLGRTISTVDTLPSPATILPARLERLEMNCPQINIYDWLARPRNARDRLPALSKIELYCQRPYGDEYPLFAHENLEHNVFEVMSETDITLDVTYWPRDWREDLNDYDLDIPASIEWVESLDVRSWTYKLTYLYNNDILGICKGITAQAMAHAAATLCQQYIGTNVV
ncbi:hypothetical protein BU25DRAFT_418458 [Macroventuria anomochaeta]|uniref:Uncharacterized protein n=1 Tax=Macroventuria anomochaeta TaxID=301207 RepID=A0ACB6SEK3_9PLEO|nr:uncharacterized protein BU25DRAFT_418458 [Macroventuria anomochaeta]KAF2631689.1 hypothetical protein BU25DRAFT_418458 [Macroventuria anomochaeta]